MAVPEIATQILSVAVGVALIGAVATDVFMTVFSPAEYGGPLTRRQNRVLWAAVRRVAHGRQGRARHRTLALAAPVMALTTIIVWITLLVVGFAFIYLPWIDTFIVTPEGRRSLVVDAFYFSASTATTLSIGDLIPNRDLLRLLAPLETLMGIGLLTAVLQYTLAISQHAQGMAALALDIAVHFDPQNAPEHVADRVRGAEDAAVWGAWCEDTSRSLLGLWQAHTRYPILFYFHPPSASEALPPQLGWLLRLRNAVLRGPEPGPLARHPGFDAMCRSAALYLVAVDRHFVRGGDAPRDGRPEWRDVEAAYRRLLHRTAYADPEQAAADEDEQGTMMLGGERPDVKRGG
jgi:Ion channel